MEDSKKESSNGETIGSSREAADQSSELLNKEEELKERCTYGSTLCEELQQKYKALDRRAEEFDRRLRDSLEEERGRYSDYIEKR